MLIYSILFFCISATQIATYNSQPFIGNTIYAVIVIIYTICNSKYFMKNNKLEPQS